MGRQKEKKRNIASTLIKSGFASFGSSLLTILSLVEGLAFLIGDDSNIIYKVYLWIRIVLWVMISLIISLITVFITLANLYAKKNKEYENLSIDKNKAISELEDYKQSHKPIQNKNSDSICQLLNDAYKGHRDQEVIKIGMQLSEPLWYSGKYELRARVGEIVESAASRAGDKLTLAKVLIETIGWTNIRLGNNTVGIQTIQRGLNVAIDIGDNYWIASAYRNLADIHLGIATANHSLRYSSEPITISFNEQQKEFDACLDFLNKAEACIAKISKADKRNDLAGNVYYTFSKLYFEKRDYTNALAYVEYAKKSYIKNKNNEKQIKLYNLKGEILLCIPSRKAEAINVFQEGLKKATDDNVNVHIVSNALSLADCFFEMKQIEQTNRMLNTAKEYVSAVTDPILLTKYQNLVSKVNNNG